jgi:hypothetical protein
MHVNAAGLAADASTVRTTVFVLSCEDPTAYEIVAATTTTAKPPAIQASRDREADRGGGLGSSVCMVPPGDHGPLPRVYGRM